MRYATLKRATATALFVFCWGCSGSKRNEGADQTNRDTTAVASSTVVEHDTGQQPSPSPSRPASIVIDLRFHNWGGHSTDFMYEVVAKPGDCVMTLGPDQEGVPSGMVHVAEIINDATAKFIIDEGLNYVPESKVEINKRTFTLTSGDFVKVWVPSCDGGTVCSLRISEYSKPPEVKADDANVVEAIKAYASVAIDGRGSVQTVEPPLPPDTYPRRVRNTANRSYRFDGFSEDVLCNIAKLNNLRRLDAHGSLITDASVVHLKVLNCLVFLDLSNSKISDDGLRILEGLKRLESLELANTKISDAGLHHLAGLQRLETLNLSKTNIGNAGLSHLVGLCRLQSLDLSGTKIDDAAVASLAQLKSLKRLELRNTGVTPFGYFQLCQALPRCCRVADYWQYWGSVWMGNKRLGPQDYAGDVDEDERLISRLLLLGCSMAESSDEKITRATLNVSNPLSDSKAADPWRTTSEILDLLPKLESIQTLRIENHWPKSARTLDDAVLAKLAKLPKLQVLYIFQCPLTKHGWKSIASLSRLRELEIMNDGASDEIINDLRNELPNCKISDGKRNADDIFR